MKVMPDKMCKPVWTRQQPRWISYEVRADVDGLLIPSYFVMLNLSSKDAPGKKHREVWIASLTGVW